MAKDVYFQHVALLAHFDGADDGVLFPDVKGNILTVFGAVKTKTGVKKFGTASAYFTNVNDYLRLPTTGFVNSLGYQLTVEAWVYLTGNGTYGSAFLGQSGTGANQDQDFGLKNDGKLTYFKTAGMGGSAIDLTAPSALTQNVWHHVALTLDGTTARLFQDGILVASAAYSEGWAASSVLPTIGKSINTGYPGYARPFIGYMDDFRITKYARYTANFTPSTEPFPDGGYEVAGTILDSNGNPAARTLRAYRRDTGVLIGQGVSNAVTGTYNIAVDHDQEVQVVLLDDALGTVENDQILRTTPV